MKNAKIRESAEDYLEAILILGKKTGRVRAIDIAAYLEYSKPSISIAMKKLRLDGLIETAPQGDITLTTKGRKVAEAVYERHIFISQWLISLGVDENTALADACKMEHALSPASFNAIKNAVIDKN
ncbi:MAG: metal-dependent transcriptional regulator [Defluviitaleaceae bacterium]|nr:metal-dependent transcriptional regulator [Defluviitaleaceae bacterium]